MSSLRTRDRSPGAPPQGDGWSISTAATRPTARRADDNRAKVSELNELQRRLETSEEERHRAHAELQAEQSRLSFMKGEKEAVSCEFTAYRAEMQERLDLLMSSHKQTEVTLRAALLCEAEQVDAEILLSFVHLPYLVGTF